MSTFGKKTTLVVLVICWVAQTKVYIEFKLKSHNLSIQQQSQALAQAQAQESVSGESLKPKTAKQRKVQLEQTVSLNPFMRGGTKKKEKVLYFSFVFVSLLTP